METNELKILWQTLAKEKLIENELAEENIERIIALKSSLTVEKLNKKLKVDFSWNLIASLLITAITIFAAIFLKLRNQHLPVQGYIFLILCISFYAIKSLDINSKINLLKLSFSTSTIRDSLQNVKARFEKTSLKGSIITYFALIILTVYANILINENAHFSNFNINSLQGYVLLFSIIYLITLPWIANFYFKKRFSGIIGDINSSINELEENRA
jgi:hypothetical protein